MHIHIQSSTPQVVTFSPPEIRQQLINECHQWSKDNGMQLNASKTKVTRVTISVRNSGGY
jgi:hypothetical protein